VTFGITPTAPETGFGYIQSGAAFTEAGQPAEGGCVITRFVEKPNLARAQAYLGAGTYRWNSGLFMMREPVWLAAMSVCRPDIFMVCRAAWRMGPTDGEFVRVDKEALTGALPPGGDSAECGVN
jgi:mannose-1-phosphate guanylyltransferase/mannose-6-phosphate isomerase